ncbi:lebercilin-like [Daktulosphaira vitifoliae]|uniref:lebercilin-like n=1 Tax=Daktulosphaira vitifoliae TaxID=58002 RepID=UPI0021A9D1DE|nr:lebercilin-like [Daktulosphaira vitifoliae]
MNNNKAHELFKYLCRKNNNSNETVCQYPVELPSQNSKNFTRAPKPQNKKKIIKPLTNNKLSVTKRQPNTNISRKTVLSKNTGNQTTVSRLKNVTRDNLIIKIQQLENENVEIQNKYQKLLTENRILKTMEKRQEHALLFYEGTEAKLPQIMKSLNDDIQVYKGRIKQMQSTYKELENRYRSQSTELSMMTKKHNHLLNLSKNKNLNEREKLQDQLKDAQNTISHQEKKIENLMKNLELQCKSYQHHIILEKNKNKELQKELIKMKSMNDNINLKNNNFQNNTARLFLKNQTVTHSISHSPCAVKTMTNNDLTEKEDNKSLYKINAKSLNENCNGNNRNHMNDLITRTQNKNPILFNKENIEDLHNDIKIKSMNDNINLKNKNFQNNSTFLKK